MQELLMMPLKTELTKYKQYQANNIRSKNKNKIKHILSKANRQERDLQMIMKKIIYNNVKNLIFKKRNLSRQNPPEPL